MDERPPHSPAPDAAAPADPLARFRSWRGFLLATVAVNALFVYTLLAHNSPEAAIWHKALLWLPATAVFSAAYLAAMVRLARQYGPRLYTPLCLALIVANWVILIFA